MNKKGVTLIELMAVIAIIAMLSIMIIPGIISIRNSVLESSYQNKISQIENAGIDFGTQNMNMLKTHVANNYNGLKVATSDCTKRSVEFLITNGYLNVANTHVVSEELDTQLTDPRDNSSMNGLMVCIRYDTNDPMTREIIAYVIEE